MILPTTIGPYVLENGRTPEFHQLVKSLLDENARAWASRRGKTHLEWCVTDNPWGTMKLMVLENGEAIGAFGLYGIEELDNNPGTVVVSGKPFPGFPSFASVAWCNQMHGMFDGLLHTPLRLDAAGDEPQYMEVVEFTFPGPGEKAEEQWRHADHPQLTELLRGDARLVLTTEDADGQTYYRTLKRA